MPALIKDTLLAIKLLFFIVLTSQDVAVVLLDEAFIAVAQFLII